MCDFTSQTTQTTAQQEIYVLLSSFDWQTSKLRITVVKSRTDKPLLYILHSVTTSFNRVQVAIKFTFTDLSISIVRPLITGSKHVSWWVITQLMGKSLSLLHIELTFSKNILKMVETVIAETFWILFKRL